jgi:UDP-N-acetylglucosamine--N-acetylmuramyl-(pentapeptide) pyrophosphoryl-undecaprenol N-acetylglucosamine transferase
LPGSFDANVKAETVGNPVRAEIAAIEEPASRFSTRQGPIRLLILGGSQGALALNQFVPAALALLPADKRPVVRHQAGQNTLDQARAAYDAHSVQVELTPYIEDMAGAYGWADLVICRSGALTVAELSAAGLAAIFVPFPAAVDDHQTANARPMVNVGAAEVIQQSALSDESFATLLKSWTVSRDVLLERARKARSLARPDALHRITGLCLESAGVLT